MSMARYFFHIYNGAQRRDDVGTDCADTRAVRTEAVESMKEIIADRLFDEGDTSSITVNVVDAEGRTVLIASLAASVEVVQGSSLAA
jgi:hypothetical protein